MELPYTTAEVAAAIMAASRRRGPALRQVEVRADAAKRIWTVRTTDPSGGLQVTNFPFASARGISTPAEIAAHVVGGSWPFGG